MVAIALALWVPRFAGPLDLRYDAGVYYILGTALAEGRGYRLLNEPGAIEAIQYPPLLPLFVAAHQWAVRAVGRADPVTVGHVMRWSYAAMFVAYGLVLHAFLRRHLAPSWALLGSVLCLLHLQLVWLSDLLFAELPFALCTVLFLVVAERQERKWRPGVLAIAAYLLRSAGIAVLAAWAADALLRGRYRAMLVRVTFALVPLLVWQTYIARVQHGDEYRHPAYAYQRAPYQYYNVGYLENMAYLDSFAPERGRVSALQLAERVGTNLLRLPVALGASVSVDAGWLRGTLRDVNERHLPWPIPLDVANALLGVLGLACVAGQALLAWRGARLVPLYWLGSLLLIAVTPWELQFGRYLMPLAPLTVLGLLTTLGPLARRTSRPLLRFATITGLGAIVLTQTLVLAIVFLRQHPSTAAGDQRLFFYGPPWREHEAAVAWLARAAAPDQIVATSTPYWVHLATGLRAVLPPFEADAAEAERLLDDVPVDYLVIDDLDFVDITRRYAERVVLAHPERWRLVHGSPTNGSRIYRRDRGE